ncbi:LptF/LptG family permease [Flexithrix dorotheae]|uniref:LptF/LptG family permease n=1 Tax=Flexithrix dorotheae TaxID=70993 RepID=UPI001FDEF35F|nr:LptF/LptG family permease [Flexithrix dorotheae]
MKKFAGPFVLTFAVLLFIFLSHSMILNFKHLMGKGLGFEIYLELFFYFSLVLTPLTLPLSVLLASLMAFGGLGEHGELNAIKSAGISLPRILMPISLIIISITVAAFFFNDQIAPWANLKTYNLLYDVRHKKPTLEFKPNTFYYDLPRYRIKVENKSGPGNEVLEGIMIYDHTQKKGNSQLIMAKHGTMKITGNFLELILESGNIYAEKPDQQLNTSEYFCQNFETANFRFSLDSYGFKETQEELFKYNNNTKTTRKLIAEKDSISMANQSYSANLKDSILPIFVSKEKREDSHKQIAFQQLGKAKINSQVRLNKLNEFVEIDKKQVQLLNNYKIDIYKKFTKSVAVFVMFLIGAPLGAIIKKGGLGLPVLISIIFFVIFYISTIIGEKYAKEMILSPETGCWLGNVILLGFGLFFLRQAKRDARLFDTDFYLVVFSNFWEKGKIVLSSLSKWHKITKKGKSAT